MFKMLKQKLNKKGFTLAELLVVVAIIAILVAIAIPIFTGSMREAQLRTNQANVRSVKAVGVTEILTNWSKNNVAGARIRDGVDHGWLVKADVDNNGNVTLKSITVLSTNPTDSQKTGIIAPDGANKGALVEVTDTTTDEFANLKPKYEVQVLLTSADVTTGVIAGS